MAVLPPPPPQRFNNSSFLGYFKALLSYENVLPFDTLRNKEEAHEGTYIIGSPQTPRAYNRSSVRAWS